MRRAGQDHQHAAAFFDPLAGRGAAIVRQYVRALDHHRLTPVDFGHGAIHRAKTLLDAVVDRGIEDLPAVERHGDCIAREIVFGGSESARDDDELRGAQRAPDRAGQTLEIVADHVFGRHFDAQIVQLLGQEERIRIDALVRQHLGADGYDLGVHRRLRYHANCEPRTPTSTRKIALVVDTIMARVGENARPTMPGPETKRSALRSGVIRTTPLRPM